VTQARHDRDGIGIEPDDLDGVRPRPRRAVAELAPSVVPPAQDGAVTGHRARVVRARTDRDDAARESADLHRSQPRAGRPVTELTLVVLTPAPTSPAR